MVLMSRKLYGIFASIDKDKRFSLSRGISIHKVTIIYMHW